MDQIQFCAVHDPKRKGVRPCFATVRTMQEEGMLLPLRQPSLLGLHEEGFSVHSGESLADSLHAENAFHRRQPGEFISIAYDVLDALATAALSRLVGSPVAGSATLQCRLQNRSSLTLVLSHAPETECSLLPSGWAKVRFLGDFARTLSTKGLLANFEPEVIFLGLEEEPAFFLAYPGKMQAAKSPYLADRPEALWPIAKLRVPLTRLTLERAKTLVDFLGNFPDGKPSLQ